MYYRSKFSEGETSSPLSNALAYNRIGKNSRLQIEREKFRGNGNE